MNSTATPLRARGPSLPLLAFESLPCGCVAGVYQTASAVVEVELVEAKGPHCVFPWHRTGEMTRIALPESALEASEEAIV
ncbi:MAG TPA: hypothetical protein VFV95_21310 [Vicinamibacterales bacterium]|nr:hypothetical protein [Vicinamibacterales bacterium]